MPSATRHAISAVAVPSGTGCKCNCRGFAGNRCEMSIGFRQLHGRRCPLRLLVFAMQQRLERRDMQKPAVREPETTLRELILASFHSSTQVARKGFVNTLLGSAVANMVDSAFVACARPASQCGKKEGGATRSARITGMTSVISKTARRCGILQHKRTSYRRTQQQQRREEQSQRCEASINTFAMEATSTALMFECVFGTCVTGYNRCPQAQTHHAGAV